MHENSESIYGCGPVDLPVPEWGRLTGKDGVIYAHFFNKSGYCVSVNGLDTSKVDYALHLEDYSEIKLGEFWNKSAWGANVAIPFKGAEMKNEIDTVVKLVLKK
jgi:alpha-L-fucosidase